MNDFFEELDIEVSKKPDTDLSGKFNKDYEDKKQNFKKNNNWKNNKSKNWNKNKKKGIDLFKELPEPKPIDFEKVKISKTATIAIANKSIKLTDEDIKKFHNVFMLLKDKGYKIRALCNTFNQVLGKFMEIIPYDKVEIVKPWDKFCKTGKYKTLTPTDPNKQAAAYYYNNFNNLPTGGKYLASAMIEVLFGPWNNDALEMVILYDPFYDEENKKIDFENSKDTAFYYWFPKSKFKDWGISIYNLYKDEDYLNLIEVLK